MLLLAFLASTSAIVPGAAPPDKTAPASTQMAQLSQQRKPIIRVHPAPPKRVPPIRYKEKNAPKCVQASELAGLLITREDAIDLILRGGQRMRAKLEKGCTSVDFYSGFYMKPARDGRICEDRDMIHSRAGGACEIDKFTLLVPVK